MHMQKYLLPATLAATVHVALLWFLPEESYVRLMAVAQRVPPPKPPEAITEPPEEVDRPNIAEPVKPLPGRPAPPELEDNPPAKLPDSAFTMPVDTRPRNFTRKITNIPDKVGDESGILNGSGMPRLAFFSPVELDNVPRAKVQLPPDYPCAMKQAGVGGSVWVEFDVNAEGRVIRAEAVRCTHREFSEPAVRAVKKWRFEPGRRNGQAVPFRLTVPIEFGLEDR